MYRYVASRPSLFRVLPCCGSPCLPAELLRGNITRWKTPEFLSRYLKENYPPTRDLHISFVEQNANLHQKLFLRPFSNVLNHWCPKGGAWTSRINITWGFIRWTYKMGIYKKLSFFRWTKAETLGVPYGNQVVLISSSNRLGDSHFRIWFPGFRLWRWHLQATWTST